MLCGDGWGNVRSERVEFKLLVVVGAAVEEVEAKRRDEVIVEVTDETLAMLGGTEDSVCRSRSVDARDGELVVDLLGSCLLICAGCAATARPRKTQRHIRTPTRERLGALMAGTVPRR